jgi:uncharacterized protein
LWFVTPSARRTGSANLPLHGGKDGTPFPVDRETYDQTIETLSAAPSGADIDRSERVAALRRLTQPARGA